MGPIGQKKQQSGNTGSAASMGGNEPDKTIRFISLLNVHMIEDMDAIRHLLNERGFSFDYSEFKIVNTTIQKRLISKDKKDGPRERVEVEEKVEVNANFKYLRQIAWKVLKDVDNVLLIQMNQLKGIPCGFPLVFPSIHENNHRVMVCGITDNMRLQLISKPDLKFRKVPEPIEGNASCKEQILNRADREKGMQAIARELQDFSGLPKDIKKKINELAAGGKVPLTDAEAVNMILLSDLYTRYLPMFQTFQTDISSRGSAVSALASQFAEMTKGIKVKEMISMFREYLMDEDTDDEGLFSQNNAQLFNYLYKKAQHIDEKRVKIGDRPLTRAGMYGIMRSIITFARSKIDPDLWSKCLFFYKHNDPETSEFENQQTLDTLTREIYSQLLLHRSASSQSLLEIYLIHNIHRYMKGRRALIGKATLSDIEHGVIKSVVVPQLYQPNPSVKQPETIRLFLDMNIKPEKLITPIHTVGRVYGFLLGRRLREGVQEFLKPGLRDLLSRFGNNFFSIFYEMVVMENNLPISRNQFAKWLKHKGYFKTPEDMGHIPNSIEKVYDPLLTPKVLSELGQSVFPNAYSQNTFEKDHQAAKESYAAFLNTLRKNATNEEYNVEKIILSFIDQGNHNCRSQLFRDHIKKSFLNKALSTVVAQCCVDIKAKIKEMSVGNKIILKIPFEFEPLLYLENLVSLKIGDEKVQAHLISVPVKKSDELDGLSKKFSENLSIYFKRLSDPGILGLVSAMSILKEFQRVSMDFVKHTSLIVLDRQVNLTLSKMRQNSKQTPNHIKFHYNNYEKLIIGNEKKINLGKLIQYDSSKKTKDTYYNMPMGEILQAIASHKSAHHKLREYRETIYHVQTMLESFSSSMKEDYESITYSKQIQKLSQLLSTPIDELSENVLNIISILAGKIGNTVRQGINKKGVLYSLYSQWNKQYSSNANKIDFYLPFIREGESRYDQRLYLEIAKTREVLLNISRRKCLLFFPEKQRDNQLKSIAEIGSFIVEREYDLNMYIEINYLSKEDIEELSKVFFPKNFFQIDKISPLRL
ncbi:hypothetical protein KKA14_16990 [bacterium]|nr:hypothetical protein [bacterium]